MRKSIHERSRPQPLPEKDLRWKLPSRGQVGMYCLIAAELAIFTIFVVAYIFTSARALRGRSRGCSARSHLLHDLFALEQPDDSLCREVSEGGKVVSFALWWLLTIVLGAIFLGARRASGGTDLRRRADHPNQFVRDHLLLPGRPARVSRNGWPACSCVGRDFTLWACETGARRTAEVLSMYWHFVDVVWVVVFTVVYIIGR
jgi:cytochrome c oxidase subunit III